MNTNEDVGDFHLELRTRSFPQTTLFERDISYDTRCHSNCTNFGETLITAGFFFSSSLPHPNNALLCTARY